MKKIPCSAFLLLSGAILIIISCRKTGNQNNGQALYGTCALHFRDYHSNGSGGTNRFRETFSGNKATYQFSPNGKLTFLPENSAAKYHLNLQDSSLDITPDSCIFLNVCYFYFQSDPNLDPFPRRGNRTPGTLKLTYYSQDSFEVVATYVQSPGYYSDSEVVVRTGFHRDQ